ncbi:MAG: hypothetical protein IPF84_02345 [Proteobacteria bacterium]|nr:hypothetical protein [Pseudomonadota bacterium]
MPTPRRAQQHDVFLALDEVELVQAPDLLALERGWKAKSNDSSVFTAGSREERIAASSRRLLRSETCAVSRRLIASVAASRPPSISRRMPSTASSEPGILRSASRSRMASRG